MYFALVVDNLCNLIIVKFDEKAPSFYNEEDRKKGYIIARNRKNQEEQVSFLSISIGVVTNEARQITHVAQISEIGAELKSFAKSKEGSTYIKDKRQ